MDERDHRVIVQTLETLVKQIVLPAAKEEARTAAVEQVDTAVRYHVQNLAAQFRLTRFHRIGPVEIALRRVR